MDASKEGLEILPLQYHHQAELYPYVSKPVSRTARYAHERLARDKGELNTVEDLVANGRLEQRQRTAFFDERGGGKPDTLFLSFRRRGDSKDAHASVSATKKDALIGFSTAAVACRSEVEAHLDKHGLRCSSLGFREVVPRR